MYITLLCNTQSRLCLLITAVLELTEFRVVDAHEVFQELVYAVNTNLHYRVRLKENCNPLFYFLSKLLNFTIPIYSF